MNEVTEKGTVTEIENQESRIENRGLGISYPQSPIRAPQSAIHISLLTGGEDKPYVLGLTEALASQAVSIDVIGGNGLEVPELVRNCRINFLNLRGDQRPDASLKSKAFRIVRYYIRLICYAIRAQPRIFHILWNNKFEFFDRTLLLLHYKLLGKKLAFTAHNVNIRKRDCTDSWLNRFSLRIQYRLVDHVFVHTERMKSELVADFGVSESKISVIPFGINNTSPTTAITTSEAKERLGLSASDKTVLFFGQIAPYKGLEYLIAAFSALAKRNGSYRLIIAGKVKKGHAEYWPEIKRRIMHYGIQNQIIERIEHIPDEEVELYFKAADVLTVPYVQIFQSGVPFLAYSFGLPVIATDVGSLRAGYRRGEDGLCLPAAGFI